MNTKARVILTLVLGIAMGVTTWLGAEGSSPPGSGYVLSALTILVPLIVGRWWVLAALAGQLVALVALQLTGQLIHGLDSEVSALPWGIAGLVVSGLFFSILVGIRKAFDRWRHHRATRKPLDTGQVASNSSDS
jgi:hypothetical protein